MIRQPSQAGLRQALGIYRVLAYIVGVGLATLVFIGMPLQYFAHDVVVVEIVGPIHGVFYIIYLVAALNLAFRARFSFLQLIGIVASGLLPVLAFVMERNVTHRVEGLLEELAA